MVTFIYQADDKDLERMMDRAERWQEPANMSPVIRDEFGSIMRDDARQRFASESYQGAPWVPLRPATIRIREAKGYGEGPINVRTGQMKRFITQSIPQGGPSSQGVEMSWPRDANGELYIKMLRAQGWTSTVARPVIGMDETDMTDLIDALYADFERSM